MGYIVEELLDERDGMEDNAERLLMEIHSVHIPQIHSNLTRISTKLDNHSSLLRQIVEMKDEVGRMTLHLESIALTLGGFGRDLVRGILTGFGLMLLVGCLVVTVAIVAITKVEFSGKGMGIETVIGVHE